MKKFWIILGLALFTPMVTLSTTLVPKPLLAYQPAKPLGPLQKVFYDKVESTYPLPGSACWKHPHLKLVNATKERAKFILYFRDNSGNSVPVKKQDEKGNESTEANTFILEPGKDIHFLHDKYDFKNAPGKCIVKVEARILKSGSNDESNEKPLYIEAKKGEWCIQKEGAGLESVIVPTTQPGLAALRGFKPRVITVGE